MIAKTNESPLTEQMLYKESWLFSARVIWQGQFFGFARVLSHTEDSLEVIFFFFSNKVSFPC